MLSAVSVVCVKLLLFPAYASTDAEVHAHWQALTRSASLCQWYTDTSSINTLDYPPLFAHLERVFASLAHATLPAGHARYCLTSLAVETTTCNPLPQTSVHFLRATVLISGEPLLATGALMLLKDACISLNVEPSLSNIVLALVLVQLNPSLLFVDNVHLQYNGLCIGLLLISLSLCCRNCPMSASIVFSVLVHMKHVFVYASLPLAFYLLSHCKGSSSTQLHFARCAICAIPVTGVSVGPILYCQTFSTMLSNLAPFDRGLVHSFWAPNFWALYALTEKALTFAIHGRTGTASLARGQLGQGDFTILPVPTPNICFLLVVMAQAPAIVQCMRNPNTWVLVRCVACSLCCAFMFGWHMHEKAAIMIVLPLAVQAASSTHSTHKEMVPNWQTCTFGARHQDTHLRSEIVAESKTLSNACVDAHVFWLFSLASGYGCHHLLHEPRELTFKWLTHMIYHVASARLLNSAQDNLCRSRKGICPGINIHIGFALLQVGIELYCLVHPMMTPQLPFLPSMLRSTGSAVAIVLAFVQLQLAVIYAQ